MNPNDPNGKEETPVEFPKAFAEFLQYLCSQRPAIIKSILEVPEIHEAMQDSIDLPPILFAAKLIGILKGNQSLLDSVLKIIEAQLPKENITSGSPCSFSEMLIT